MKSLGFEKRQKKKEINKIKDKKNIFRYLFRLKNEIVDTTIKDITNFLKKININQYEQVIFGVIIILNVQVTEIEIKKMKNILIKLDHT